MTKKNILIYTGSAIILFHFIIISLWTNLSSQKLTPWVEYKINLQIPKQYRVKINNVTTFLWGMHIDQLVLNDKKENEKLLVLESLDISLNIFSLLLFQHISYNMNLYEGKIDGTLGFFPEISTSFEVDNIQPNRHMLIRQSNLIRSNPRLNAKGQVKLSEPINGKINLEIEKLTLSGETRSLNLPMSIKLPSTQISKISADLSMQKNKVDISAQASGDLTSTLKGHIQLNRTRMSNSKLQLNLKTTFNKKYESRLGSLKDILTIFKNKSGELSLKISGSIQHPNIKKL